MSEREGELDAYTAERIAEDIQKQGFSPLMSVSFWLFVSLASFVFILIAVASSIPAGLQATDAIWYSFIAIAGNMTWIPLFVVLWLLLFSLPTVLGFLIDEYPTLFRQAGRRLGSGEQSFNALLWGVPCTLSLSTTYVTLNLKDSRAMPKQLAREHLPLRIPFSEVKEFTVESSQLQRLLRRFVTRYTTSVIIQLKDRARYSLHLSYGDVRAASELLKNHVTVKRW